MKKIVFYSLCALAFVSCSKEKDLYDGNAVDKTAIDKNVQNVFGTQFDPNQDWKMITTGKVKVVANAEETGRFKVAKVQLLTANPFIDATAKVLNECEAKAGQEVKLNYDAPNYLDTLYAACVSKEGYYRVTPFAVGEENVSFVQEEAAASRGAFRAPVAQPMIVTDATPSDNRILTERANAGLGDLHPQRRNINCWKNGGWADNLFEISATVEEIPDFTESERNEMYKTLTGIMPENQDNFSNVVESQFYINTANYLLADGSHKPITVTPVRCGADFLGWEQLYYYYYNPAEVAGLSDVQRADFLKALPKYKLLDCADALVNVNTEDKVNYAKTNYKNWRNVTRRSQKYTLAYFEGTPEKGLKGSYDFPAGYRIGLMFRIDSIMSGGMKSCTGGVNLYADTLLNAQVNQFYAWANAKLSKTTSRASVFSANGNIFVGFEDYRDRDFNDVVFQVDGGVTLYEDSIQLDKNVYTMAFEDQRLGDYDMNDVVIKAQRVDLTHVKFSLEATGADFDLYLRNIDGQKLDTVTEVHEIFAKYSHIDQQGSANDNGEHRFINTVLDWPHYAAVQEVIEVPADFTFSEDKYLPYIYNKTKGYDVHIARRGEDPHAIIIPVDWRYPREYICVGGIEKKIKVAYPQFNNWGEKQVDETDWYLYPNEELIYTKSIFK